jgi:hypothetical protein
LTDVLAKLHDATLLAIHLDWSDCVCTLSFAGAPAIAGTFSISFEGVTALVVPACQPWGPSVSVLGAKELGTGQYEFEMQSGDTISVVASNYSLGDFPSISGG